jgi:SMC interacting uncharacterized protein involved in chromosome segregation
MFKICSSMIHGTRGQLSQINENIATQKELYKNLDKMIDEAEENPFKRFLLREYKSKQKSDSLYFSSAESSDMNSCPIWEYLVNLNSGCKQTIYSSDRALINKKGMFIFFDYRIF